MSNTFPVDTIRIGTQADDSAYVTIGTDGITMYGDATVFDDLRVPVTATRAGGSKVPTFVQAFDNGASSQGVFTSYFSASAEEELYFAVQLPHAWKEGSNIEPHVHWIGDADGGEGAVVRWGLEYTWANIGATYSDTTIIYTTTQVPAEDIITGRHYISDFAEIDGTGKTLSSMLLCRIFRDATNAADDYTGEAGLLEIDFHHEISRLGTDTEYA